MTDTIEHPELMPPVHPGEILLEDFMRPLGLSAGKVAKAIDVPRNRIEMIVRGRLGVSGDTAIRLGKFLRTSPDVWMNLQKRFELEQARLAIGDALERIESVAA